MTIDVADFCGTLQQDLNDIAGTNYPAMARQKAGLLEAAISTENTAGFEQVALDSADGKNKQVIIRHIQPGNYSEVATTATNICTDDGEEVSEIRSVETITRFRRSPVLKFTNAAMRDLCDGNAEYRAKVISSRMDALFQSIDRDLIGLANTAKGLHKGGTADAVDVQMMRQEASGSKIADYTGELAVIEEMQDLGLSNPFFVGAGHLSEYANLQKIGCCNDWGQDMSNAAGSFRFYRDRHVGNVIGAANNFLAFAPGALQLLTWNANKGEFRMDHAHFAETTIVDPITGIELDFDLNYDNCDKVWKMSFSLNYDLYTLPDDMYKDSDDRDGVNNLFLFNATEFVAP